MPPAIGIFGGTFDPPHAGHIAIVTTALTLGLDSVYCVPAATPVHKTHTSSFKQRYKATQQAFLHLPQVVVSNCEQTNNSSYTIDTVAHFTQLFFAHKRYLLMGSDAYHSLPTWRNWQQILDYVHLLVFSRPHMHSTPHAELVALDEQIMTLVELKKTQRTHGAIAFCHDVVVPVRSTALRTATTAW